MRTVKLRDKEFVPYLTAEEIRIAIRRMACDIKRDLGDSNPIFVCIMNGAFMFASELMQELDEAYEVDFARYSSYQGLSSTFELKEIQPVTADLKGRTVVILEDLIDSGFTMYNVRRRLLEQGADRVFLATMLLKPKALQCDVSADYVGIEIDNDFIVGHGLDYDNMGRMFPDIYILKP